MVAERARQRVVIEAVSPEIDCGAFPVRRAVGERVVVEADVFAAGAGGVAGDDALRCLLRFCREGDRQWSEVAMEPLPDDRYRAAFAVPEMGRYRYGLTAWVDPFRTWRRDLEERVRSKREVAADLQAGADQIAAAGARAQEAGRRADARVLSGLARDLARGLDPEARLRLAFDPELVSLMDRYADRSEATPYGRELAVTVDRERARFSAWYGAAGLPEGDAATRLDRAAAWGFDLFALPPSVLAERLPCLLARAREAGVEIALGVEVEGQEPRAAVERALELGVRAFAVEQPERQPFPFWERLLGEVQESHPDVLFLAGPATRGKARHHLAKLGFSQIAMPLSGPHRQADLTAEWRELASSPLADLFTPNLRPDLTGGGWPLLSQRLVLAATLASSYWVDGQALDHAEEPRERGRAGSVSGLLARLNRIRRGNPALQSNAGLAFHPVDNDRLLCYSKASGDGGNVVLTAVNLDPELRQSGWVDLDLAALGLPADSGAGFEVHDLLSGARYTWQGRRNYLELDPWSQPAHVFAVQEGRA